MLSRIQDFPENQVFQSDLCVIGAGAAGVDIARYFNAKDISLILLESGTREFDPSTQALYKIRCVGKTIRDGGYDFNPHIEQNFKDECRARMFGGTTNIWSGKWKKLEPVDLQKKSWLPFSGWPIAFEELSFYYDQVAKDYNIPNFDISCSQAQPDPAIINFLAANGIKYTNHYLETPPLNFNTEFYWQELTESRNIQVLLGANVYQIKLDDQLKSVATLVIKTLDQKTYFISAKAVVLACGGLENARLLLASNQQQSSGIGNSYDLVGRFYMDHPKGKLGVIKPTKGFFSQCRRQLFNTNAERVCFGFSLSESKQIEQQTLNHNFYIQPAYDQEINQVVSTLTLLKAAVAKRNLRLTLLCLKQLLQKFDKLLKIWLQWLVSRSISSISHYEIIHYLEQAPNYQSRLYLDENRDALGMRQLVVDWQLSSVDRESFDRFIRSMQQAFRQAKVGNIIIDGYSDLSFVRDASHHMGTTRMGYSPEDGVVDSNCQVFGIDNLFIAGSSLFPTGGNANPTYTILALSRRLCHYLESRVFHLHKQGKTFSNG